VTSHSARSTEKLLAAALALFAAGCGDGMDVQLGRARTFPVGPDGGTGDAPSSNDASADGAPDTPDSMASCNQAAQIPPQLAAFLADCEGAGCRAFGGRDGCLYEVTTESDDESVPGTLRYGLELDRPAWITFQGDFDIVLRANLAARSHKTIDGRSKRVSLRDYGVRIENRENIVITNVSFIGRPDLEDDGGLDSDDADAISLVGSGTRNIWIDHCSFLSYRDGLVDVSAGATDITVSYSHFSNHENVMLLGNSVDDMAAADMRVTLHHDWFEGTERYHPRVRYGWVHMYNNLLEAWGDFGIRATQRSRVFSEKNIYLAELDGSTEAITVEPTDKDTEQGYVRMRDPRDDLALNGAVLIANADATLVADPDYAYQPTAADDGGLLDQSIRAEAGARAP
jgi:pectate lyase